MGERKARRAGNGVTVVNLTLPPRHCGKRSALLFAQKDAVSTSDQPCLLVTVRQKMLGGMKQRCSTVYQESWL